MRVVQVNSIAKRTAGESYAGPAISLHGVLYGSFQVNVAGGVNLVGAVQVQVSNDILPGDAVIASTVEPKNWSDLGAPVAITEAGKLIAAQLLAYRWGRLVYAFTSADTAGEISAPFYGVGAG